MIAVPAWIPLLSALIGAIAAGLFQTILREIDRARERESTLSALCMEVHSICAMIRFREYIKNAQAILDEMQNDPTFVSAVVADIREDYFSVFDALSPKLGLLKAQDGAKIVEFYTICKSIKDSCHPDGVMVDNEDQGMAIANVTQFVGLLSQALIVGDQVVQFPKEPLSRIGQ